MGLTKWEVAKHLPRYFKCWNAIAQYLLEYQSQHQIMLTDILAIVGLVTNLFVIFHILQYYLSSPPYE